MDPAASDIQDRAARGWPMDNFRRWNKDWIDRGCDGRPCVLLTTGAMNPAHQGHVEMMECARRELVRRKFAVLGGWISPSHDDYVLSKMQRIGGHHFKADVRVAVVNEMVKDSGWLSAAGWEANEHSFLNFDKVCQAFRHHVIRQFKGFCWQQELCVFYVCGQDHFETCQLQGGLGDALWVCVVPRAGGEVQVQFCDHSVCVCSHASLTSSPSRVLHYSSTALRKVLETYTILAEHGLAWLPGGARALQQIIAKMGEAPARLLLATAQRHYNIDIMAHGAGHAGADPTPWRCVRSCGGRSLPADSGRVYVGQAWDVETAQEEILCIKRWASEVPATPAAQKEKLFEQLDWFYEEHGGSPASPEEHIRYFQRKMSREEAECCALSLQFYLGSGSDTASKITNLVIRKGEVCPKLDEMNRSEAKIEILKYSMIVHYLTRALRTMPLCKGLVTCSISMSSDELANYRPGNVITWFHFASCCKDETFSGGLDADVHIDSVNGRDMGPLLKQDGRISPTVHQVVLFPCTRLLVIDQTHNCGKYIITCSELAKEATRYDAFFGEGPAPW